MKKILLASVCILLAYVSFSQDIYGNELKYLSNNLQLTVKEAFADTFIVKEILINGEHIAIRIIYQDSLLTHVGLKIFSANEIRSKHFSVMRFIERKFLLYSLQSNTKDSIVRDIAFNEEVLSFGNSIFGTPGFTNFLEKSKLIINNANVSIGEDSARIAAMFKTPEGNMFFAFKRNFSLISGLNKIEADWLLLHGIEKASKSPVAKNSTNYPNPAKFKKYRDSLKCIDEPNSFCGLSNNYYVIQRNDYYVSPFNRLYPVESFVSSILYPDETSDINVILTHKQYGSDQRRISTLYKLVKFFEKDGDLFFGTEDTTTLMTGTLIVRNKELNYIHLLYFSTSSAVFFGSKPEITCKLYTYIPTDNIANLYGKDSKSGKKKIYSLIHE